MELFRIILSSILILLAIYIIIMNWITDVFYKGKKNISGTPFFGAILLIVSLMILPTRKPIWIFFIPLIIDYSCIPFIIHKKYVVK